jgi:hypothetical protein
MGRHRRARERRVLSSLPSRRVRAWVGLDIEPEAKFYEQILA